MTDAEFRKAARSLGAASERYLRSVVVKVADDNGLAGEERAKFIKQALSAEIYVGSGGAVEKYQLGPTIEQARKL